MQESFVVLTVTREDVAQAILEFPALDISDRNQALKIAESLSDTRMQGIAERLGDTFMYWYWEILGGACEFDLDEEDAT